MNTATRSTARSILVAVRAVILSTLILGVAYTLAVLGIGQALMPFEANGSLVVDAEGATAGSSLIGQSFTDDDGNALPSYFQSRPSAAGDGYDGAASGGSNLAPTDERLVADEDARRAEIAEREHVAPSDVPDDAVTASGSGLDPGISTAYAEIQIPRVAQARGLSEDEVRALVSENTQTAALGFIGADTVNVVELNLALDERRG